jgi:hypothetical protein
VGCGRALLDYWLAVLFGCKVHLVDMSRPLLRRVHRSFGDTPHTIHRENALNMPFREGAFDVVWNEGVWEHFSEDDIYGGIREMSRVSKAYVLVDVPNAACRPYRLAKAWLEENGMWQFGYEDPKWTLIDYFEKAGLDIIHERPIGNRQTCMNYINMIPEKGARDGILSSLSDVDFQVYPHILTVGKRRDSANDGRH